MKLYTLTQLDNQSRIYIYIYLHDVTAPNGPEPPHYPGCTIILRHTTVGRTFLDERSVRPRDLYLTTHNTHKIHTSITPAAFEPAIPASERPQTARPLEST